ncbi:hypothetical protein [Trichlorobacter ammonificans]|uniref:Lipoprotein n=1 Tax=Trichlorobacter ammonificans TaxID=2916410 RepID=A0ABN8HMH4_9BACT|nr:hypothetical protein [Trichlorobacter ammonificans]CAH2032426.1 conserved exported protein of unknown function [Trichlorobacter ammonificans]
MKRLALAVALFALLFVTATAAQASSDLCAGTSPGTFMFFDREVERGKPLPPQVTEFDFGKDMWAVACLTDTVGPQPDGGKKFRVVLYVKQTKSHDGKYSSYAANAKQEGVYRPGLSKPRKDVILFLNEDFATNKGLNYKLDPGEYEFRLQAATEKGTGRLDLTVDWKNDVAYIQELRKAGYVADGTIKVIKR